ncbi:PhzF family phenazine biosynthesis protein [Streptosporangium becharense]|uniref:PhzF family phenazine biosynthesis protein n=1 Tax=Streptosporangium becharense TaxID=1816182 RepID=A0A7W9IEN4_9ACTN|nr:PhzF family phenazine biosynthesis isomerase [Streptosporangium becharense]MBB2910114.1 PhzF family phenazine biosynthesis protein [Streptosporangium becharense]MBB5818931.1 PhzF family phenazine biosynthesis protein [Streptosporangium becharense]
MTDNVEILRYTAFTHDPEGGNPAGIVLDAGTLSDDEMLALAAKVGYSETAFLTARDDERRAFQVRYFAPSAEVAFCGHATIATAVALAERLGTGPLLFDTRAGEIAVETEIVDDVLRATLTSVPTRSRPAEEKALDETLAALGWSRDDLDPAFPPHVAFGGNDHLTLAAATRERLADLDYDFDRLKALMEREGWTTVNLFWRESDERFHARNPFPVGGVVEDPATGAAAAAFGGYLRTLGLGSAEFTVIQGVDMGRPSTLTVSIAAPDGRSRVSGGAVVIQDA